MSQIGDLSACVDFFPGRLHSSLTLCSLLHFSDDQIFDGDGDNRQPHQAIENKQNRKKRWNTRGDLRSDGGCADNRVAGGNCISKHCVLFLETPCDMLRGKIYCADKGMVRRNNMPWRCNSDRNIGCTDIRAKERMIRIRRPNHITLESFGNSQQEGFAGCWFEPAIAGSNSAFRLTCWINQKAIHFLAFRDFFPKISLFSNSRLFRNSRSWRKDGFARKRDRIPETPQLHEKIWSVICNR